MKIEEDVIENILTCKTILSAISILSLGLCALELKPDPAKISMFNRIFSKLSLPNHNWCLNNETSYYLDDDKALYQVDSDDVTETRLDEVASRKPRPMNQAVGTDEPKQVEFVILKQVDGYH